MSLRRRGLSHFKEIMLVLLVILCGTAVIWGSSTVFIGEEEGEKSQLNTIITQIVYVTPKELTPEPSLTRSTPSPIPAPEDVFYRVKDNESYADIAAGSGVSEAELRRLNRLSPEEVAVPGQHLLIPGRLEPQPPAATPVAPSRQLRPLEEPVSMEDIFQRLRVGTRASKTLWFEAMLVDFGPIGYIGPPNRLRAQVWFSDAQILVIAGDPQRGAEEVLVWSDGVWHQAVPGDNQPWFVTQNEINPQGIRTYPQLDLMFNTIFGDTGELGMIASLNTIGRASWAGQPVLHVTGEDRQHRHRISFWFDDLHGMILRKQWFTTADPEIVAQEIAVTAIEFDVDFPQELFDLHLPWRGSFALDVNGAPEPPTSFKTPAFIQQASRPNPLNDPGISALQEDNFNYGQLLFLYHEDFESGDLSSSAEVYLDRQHLGSAQIGNPWTMVCQRSADGRNLAYVSRPNRAEPAGSELNWLFLDARNCQRSPPGGICGHPFRLGAGQPSPGGLRL